LDGADNPSGELRLAKALCLSFLLSLVMQPAPAMSESRVALVIGNSSYQHVAQLDNPANDARLVAEALLRVGFSLVGGGPQFDLDKTRFDTLVQTFGSQLLGADVGLFYYAGHGVEVRGTNYLVPTDANPKREADIDFQMLDVNLVMRQMESAGTKLNIVILDACRNNPFSGRGLRSATSGLAQMQAPEGSLISFATQPKSVAMDGVDGNSPYAKALSETVSKPGLDLFRAFNEVGLVVSRETGGAQQPWLSSSPIKGDFYFAGKGSQQASVSTLVEAKSDTKTDTSDQAIRNGTQSGFRVLYDVSEGKLNLRKGPGQRYEIVTAIPAGSDGVRLVGACDWRPGDSSTKERWCEFQWNGKRGWAWTGGLGDVEHFAAFRVLDDVSDGELNLRSGPSQQYEIVTAIPAGSDGVRLVGACDWRPGDSSTKERWCEFEWNGRRGWAWTGGLRYGPATNPNN